MSSKMIGDIIIILTVLFLFGGVIFLYHKKEYFRDRLVEAQDEINELTQSNIKHRRDYNDMENQISNLKNEIDVEMKNWKKDIEKKYENELNLKIENVINDYDDAIKEETKAFEEKIAEIDEIIGEKMTEIMEKNTLFFTCVCDRNKPIPCFIDFSKEENFFTCSSCGAIYRVDIAANPIMISNVTNNKKLASYYDAKSIGSYNYEDNEEEEVIDEEYGE